MLFMSEKTIVLIFLMAVAAIGMIALLSNYGNTGAAIVHRNCLCSITMYDYYGSPIGVMNQEVRVRSGESWTDDACSMRCDAMFGRGYRDRTSVTGVAI